MLTDHPAHYPLLVYIVCWVIAVIAIIQSGRRCTAEHLTVKSHQHVWLAITLMILLLWTFRAGVKPGLGLHLLGAVTLTLLVGRALALLSFVAIITGMVLMEVEPLRNAPVTFVLEALLPVMCCWFWFQKTEQYLPHHLFIFIFISVFANAALTMVIVMLTKGLLLWLCGIYPIQQLLHDYWILIPLLAFPEAFLNGFIMTGLSVLHPNFILHYDDDKYLNEC